MKEVITIIKTLNLDRETTAILENAYGIGYEKQDNTIWSASFSLPINDPKVEKVKLLRYVEIPDSDGTKHLYRIIPKLTSSSNNSVTFQCEHVLATLLGVTLFKYHQLTNYTTREAIEYLLARQNHKHWKLGRCAFTRYFHYSWENENLLSAIFSVPKPLDQAYQWNFDTSTYPWTLHLDEPEVTPTCRIREGYNLVNFELEENPMSVFNRIYPLGAGEGVNQLTIESVNNGIPYIEDIGPDEEIMETTWADKRFEDPELLKASAEGLLKKWKQPTITWKTKAADVSEITGLEIDKLKQGKVLRLELKNYPLTELRIMKERRNDITGNPGDVQLEIGNVLEDLSTTNADLERRQQINELYSQGATNILSFNYQDNCDNQIPAVIPFYIDDDVVNINTCELTFRTKAFRAYSQTTKSAGQIIQATTTGGGGGTFKSSTTGGGGAILKSSTTKSGGSSVQTSTNNGSHSHIMFSGEAETQPASSNQRLYEMRDLNGNYAYGYLPTGNPLIMRTWEETGSHSHGVSIPAHVHDFELELPNHSHPFEFTLNPHTHPLSLNIPGHIHEVEHKIIELDELPSSVAIKVDGNDVPHTSTTGDRINLVDYMSKDSNGKITRGRHDVEILPSDRARIEADLILRVFIRSQLGGTF